MALAVPSGKILLMSTLSAFGQSFLWQSEAGPPIYNVSYRKGGLHYDLPCNADTIVKNFDFLVE
jgi:hypothetical protein